MSMQRVERNYILKASVPKWNMKIGEWKSNEHLPVSNIRIQVTKPEKRARKDGKENVLLNREKRIAPGRAEVFKKRKVTREAEATLQNTEIIICHIPHLISTKVEPETTEENSAAQATSKLEVLGLMPDISWALVDKSSFSNSETPPALRTSLRAKIPRATSYGPAPRESLISSPKPFRKDANHQSASEILAFGLNDMTICSQSDVLETAEKLPSAHYWSNTALSVEKKFETLLSRAVELQQMLSSIAKELQMIENPLEHCTIALTNREKLIKRTVFRALIELYQSQIILQQKATRYSLSIVDYLKDPRSSHRPWILLRHMKKLEQISKLANNGHEKELCCREAAAVTEMSFEFEDGLKHRNFLASILSELNRDEEALNLLLSGFNDYLSTRLSPAGSGPFSSIIFKEALPQKLRSEAFMQMTKLIQMLHWKTDQDGSLTGAITKLTCVQELVRTDLEFPRLADEAVIIGAMSLAFEYSQVSMFHRADLVYAFAVPELLRLRDKWYSFRKASELKDYAQHCQWSDKWIASMEALKLTLRYMELSKGYPCDALDKALITELDQLGIDFRQHWPSNDTPKSKETAGYATLKSAQLSRRELATKLNESVLGSEWWMDDLSLTSATS